MVPPRLKDKPLPGSGVKGLPTAIRSGEIRVGPVRMRCYALSDGRAIIDADDFAAFWEWLATPEADEAEVAAFPERLAAWMRES